MSDFTATVLSNGNLLITASVDGCNEIKQELAKGDYGLKDSVFYTVLEQYSTNGSFTYFDADDGNPFVGLTSAPCITECLDVDDDGDYSIIGRYWYFENYMIETPIETLCETGRVIFTLAQ